jgi:hypothetical protein
MQNYQKPAITEIGSVRALTEQGGGAFEIDVPLGTIIDPSNPNGFLGNVPGIS